MRSPWANPGGRYYSLYCCGSPLTLLSSTPLADPLASGLSDNQVVPDTMTTPRYFPCTLPGNPANFRTENTVGQFRDTETIGMGFFGYVSNQWC